MAEQTLEQLIEEKRKADEAAAELAKKIEALKAAGRKAALEEVRKSIAQHKFTADELGFKAQAATVAENAGEQDEGEAKSRRPRAIYYNAQAADGEKLYLGGRVKPVWFTDDNKSKFVVLDIAEQIKILKANSESSKAESREQWLKDNPNITVSKGS